MEYSKMTGFMIFAGAAVLALSPLCAGKLPPPKERNGAGKLPPRKERSGAGMRGMRRNAMVWRVFSQLSDAERKKMHELQRSNPEAFAAEMRKLVDKFEQQERTRIQKLKSLIEQYRKSSDKDERNRLKAEVAKMEKEIFNKRLAGLSRTISNAKRRVAMMEQEYKKRKAKAHDIVEARVDALLTGELPVVSYPPRRNAPPSPPRPGTPRKGSGR